ncbi:MAG: thymidine kinase [Bacteroidia bacterium]|nr:thymidine kinase [Bacteroidia bacterium]
MYPEWHNDNETGWIEVICGSMFSGKTEELIRRMRRAQIAKQPAVLFKPAIDIRYDKEDIVSHNNNRIPSKPVTSAQQIWMLSGNAKVIGIDEGQFFDEQIVDVANRLANNGKRVIIAGLDMDYLGKPFGQMPYLMAIAEFVTKVHAICPKTGQLAHYSFRKTALNEQVVLGEQDIYEPLSRKAYLKEMETKNKL